MATPIRSFVRPLPKCLASFQSPLVTRKMLDVFINPCINIRRNKSKFILRSSERTGYYQCEGSTSVEQQAYNYIFNGSLLCHPKLFGHKDSNCRRFYYTSRNLARKKMYGRKEITQSSINIASDVIHDAEGRYNILEVDNKVRSNGQSWYNLQYEKLNEKDETLNKIRKLLQNEKHSQYRKRSESIILEGSRLVKDALLAGAEAVCLCFCHPETLEQLGEAQGLLSDVKLYRISPATMKIFSDTVTPGGILGVFKKPGQGEVVCPAQTTLPISLVFDRLRDPGNAGTLIRTAAAVGCRRIFATEGCVNLWERKVLRSAMGAHFSIAIYTGISWNDLSNYLSPKCEVYLANNFTANTLSRAFDSQINSETLNEGLERTNPYSEDENMSPFINQTVTDTQMEGLSESDAYKFHNVPLPVFEYSEVPLISKLKTDDSDQGITANKHLPPDEVALVIGSEAAGLSALAKKFAYDHYGAYVTIPMNETTNSLNSGVAGSVILYELRKKLVKCV